MNRKKQKSLHLDARSSSKCISPASASRQPGTSSASGSPSIPRSATCASCDAVPSCPPRYASSTASWVSCSGVRRVIFSQRHRLSQKHYLLSDGWLLFVQPDIGGVNQIRKRQGSCDMRHLRQMPFLYFTSVSTKII